MRHIAVVLFIFLALPTLAAIDDDLIAAGRAALDHCDADQAIVAADSKDVNEALKRVS
jgi:hypothetical protein